MSRIAWSRIVDARAASAVNAVFSSVATESARVDDSNIMPESLDRLSLPNRPVWERLDTLARTARTGPLAASVPFVVLSHGGNLAFNFAAYALTANQALRFCSWISWEATLSSGLGIVGTMEMRWALAGVQLDNGALIGLRRPNGVSDQLYHGQSFVEGWIVGPTTVNGNVQVEYTYAGPGVDAYPSKSLTYVDLFKQYGV